MAFDQEQYIAALKAKLESYHSPISSSSWELIRSIIKFQTVDKGTFVLRYGQIARNIHFICQGALRAYFTDEAGNFYNKNIFLETDLACSTVSLLQNSPSNFTLEALEDCIFINLNYKKYRAFIDQKEDLKNFYIAYLEKNWVLEKEPIEISIVMENATERYLKLLEKHPNIDQRIPQRHLSAHLGITPTQLSRIRKSLK
ncbi:Crp/Fnr family transcriptional regulator [Aureispira anguillae]|uniref:Cyclic nucleotide-binding domain-containing protein n=1 Tax=Aureispira anguillae TaxID=2864201 RepID=A0A916DUE8_9BACT|nr:cyclic nucleotide-binding domain-containing protein [Aureispira anguillae]BDS12627.1 cyclic nucleotide-binding domain-containing protein [Aureispira anguillae]